MVFRPHSTDAEGRTPYTQCMQSGQPVFATEYKRGRVYFACSYEEFCDDLCEKAPLRCFHEILRPDVRTKIFMDFDHPLEGGDYDEQRRAFERACDAFTQDVIRHIVNKDPTLEGLRSTEDFSGTYYRLLSHRSNKLSMHVVLPFTMSSLVEVGAFVKQVHLRLGCRYLDRAVYKKNHSMRVVYSVKYGTEHMLLPDDGDATYDPEIAYQTLIQNTGTAYPSNFHQELHPSDFGITTATGCSGSGLSVPLVHDDPIVPRLQRSVERCLGKVSSPVCTEHFVKFTLHANCYWSGRRHKNNHQYIWYIRRTRTLKARCMDPDCVSAYYLEIKNWRIP